MSLGRGIGRGRGVITVTMQSSVFFNLKNYFTLLGKIWKSTIKQVFTQIEIELDWTCILSLQTYAVINDKINRMLNMFLNKFQNFLCII